MTIDKFIKYHEYDCEKCCGSGKTLDDGVCQLITQWRKTVGITAKDLAADLNIPYTSYCKFEKGKIFFSEACKRIIVEYLRVKQLEGE